VTIGDRIKQIRGVITRDEFANRLEIHRNTLANYETGSRAPDLNFIEKLLSIHTEIAAGWLLTGEGPVLKEDVSKIDPTVFYEIVDAVDELLPEADSKGKYMAILDYYNFFAASEFKPTKEDVIKFAKFTIEFSDKLNSLGGFDKVKEGGIENFINIIGSLSNNKR
jgi:transcriptional regulator with XRE-family HTH domain